MATFLFEVLYVIFSVLVNGVKVGFRLKDVPFFASVFLDGIPLTFVVFTVPEVTFSVTVPIIFLIFSFQTFFYSK